MKNNSTKKIIMNYIALLIPFVIYGIYKNGYLLYCENLISFIAVFKPLYLIIISCLIKIIMDYIKHKKIVIDFNFVYVILVSMIMPPNINLFIYSISLIMIYLITNFLEKYLKFNKVCLIYLIIIIINAIFNNFSFLNLAETKYTYSFTILDYIFGRNVGGISSTSIFFSLLVFVYLINSIYYKKDIPLVINLTYLTLSIITFLITKDTSIIINSEVLFGSIFISSLPLYSPYKIKNQIIYGVIIGIITYTISLTFNKTVAIYIATLIVSLFMNLKFQNIEKIANNN